MVSVLPSLLIVDNLQGVRSRLGPIRNCNSKPPPHSTIWPKVDSEFGKTYFTDLFYAVPAGDIDVDIPVAVTFRDYLAGGDPVLEAVLSR